MKKLILICFLAIFFIPFFALAQEPIEIDFFYSPTCPHCHEEQIFLDELEKEYAEIKVNRFNVFEKENVELLKVLYQQYDVAPERWGLVPVTFTPENAFIGFSEKIGEDIKNCLVELCMGGRSSAVESEDSTYN